MAFSVFRTKSDDPMFQVARRRLFRSSPSVPSPSLSAQSSLQDVAAAANKDEDAALNNLNSSLRVLATIFPNVRPDVFREMLGTFSDESRLHVVAEQLIKHSALWVNGRWRVSPHGTSSKILREVYEVEPASEEVATSKELVPREETFRSQSYKRAVRAALSQELKTLSRSTIEGVLAEQNYSYTLSRPILHGLAAKSWRINFSTLLSRWRKSNHTADDSHYMLVWSKPSAGIPTHLPSLRPTGSPELDQELYETILKPVLDQRQETQDVISLELATLLNEQEAEEAQATFECECCFSDATFEAMATCSDGTHIICFRCIQHAVSEALYGQSWGLNVDHIRSQVACIAPASTPCQGCIPHELARRAILQTKGGFKTWSKFESRLSDDCLRASGAKFMRCPFCSYAELDDLYLPDQTTNYRLNTSSPVFTVLLAVLACVLLFLFFPQYFFLSKFAPSTLSSPADLIKHALEILIRKTHLPSRFLCPNPDCARPSCRCCKAAWRDPHTCYESAALSLRTTVEAARTAALKRTCPRCGLAFVKESGCNKMVCVCGYIMCYICRQGLGRKSFSPAAAEARRAQGLALFRLGGALGGEGGDGEEDEGEGYRHFCQHFRPAGGRCGECERCDLYRGEDEDEIVSRAGKRAEVEWRKRQGAVGKSVAVAGGKGDGAKGLQGLVDWWVSKLVKC